MIQRTLGALLLTLACVTGGDAAVKPYQFTGVVKTVMRRA